MKVFTPSQLVFTINVDESHKFPELFAALESESMTLGVTSISINCPTTEDVFLRVVGGENKGSTSLGYNIGKEDSKITKLRGPRLTLQQIKAMVYKRIMIRVKSWKSTLIFITAPVALMAATILQIMYQEYSPVQNKLKISLSSFPKVTVAAHSYNQTISSAIKQIVTSGEAKYQVIPKNMDFENYMIEQLKGEHGLIQYERSMIAGFDADTNSLNGGYSHYFDHSFALVLNLIPNLLMRINNISATITVFCHPIAVYDLEDECDRAMDASNHVTSFPLKVIFLSLGLLITTMSLIPFPLRERVIRLKQLQIMSGVSPLLYWFVLFLCDFAFFIFTVALMVCMVFLFDQDSVFTSSGYVSTVTVILVLFGCSGIVFAYFFSFFVKSAVKATVSFVVFNLAVGLFGSALQAILDKTYTYYGVWRFMLSFNPLFAATSALIHLFTIMYSNGTCLQCGYNCNMTSPFHFLEPGQFSENPHGINSFLIFLVIDFFIYSGLVLSLEYGIMKRVKFLILSLWIKHEECNLEDDPDVKIEKDGVLSDHKLGGLLRNSSILQVYDLGKKYNRKTTAVHGVTFQVGLGECFGLLGVNGAGKTTTFKMLTGEEIPDKGDAIIHRLSLTRDKSMFLSQVGYCPQFDPLSPLLTGKEMLTIFALLRGIPPEQCNSEVCKWIQVLGLAEYAERPCGNYSGGNKRKLCTAMAHIGAPSVVFLDEPTSGVDPVSRRKLWDVVARCQRMGQAIVLTSHSMEECEALCTRLTIMVGGRMKCIGSPHYLKQKFGQGYTIKLKINSSTNETNNLIKLKNDIMTDFKKCKLKDEHLGLLHYHSPDTSEPLASVFKKLELLKKDHSIIEDYVVSHTTLEEVFMSFARRNV